MENTSEKRVLFGNVAKVIRHGEFPLHKHIKDELYICLGGSAKDFINGAETEILPGDVYVLSADTQHWQTDMNDFRCCIFNFDMDALISLSKTLDLSEKSGFRSLFVDDMKDKRKGLGTRNFFVDINTLKYAEQVADIMQDENDPDILDILFLSLVSVVSAKCRRRETGEKWRAYEKISEVVYYIEQNFEKPLTLPELAALSHYSQRHFTRLVREYYGKSPMEYLDKIRIKNACELLLHSTLGILQISQMCGFEDNNLFSRHFRASLGVSPTAYRKQNQIAEARVPDE